MPISDMVVLGALFAVALVAIASLLPRRKRTDDWLERTPYEHVRRVRQSKARPRPEDPEPVDRKAYEREVRRWD